MPTLFAVALRAGRFGRVVVGGAALGLTSLVVLAGPAAAEFEENTIGCAGSAVITSNDGATTEVSADDAKVTVPRSGVAAWEGSVDTVTHNHFGVVNLELGPATVELGGWGPTTNDKDESTKSGVRRLPSALGGVPPGRYVVSGYHQGDEGRCAGSIQVDVEGNPLTHPVSAGAAAGTVLTGGLLALAGRPNGGVA